MDGTLVGAAYSPVFDSHVIQMLILLGTKKEMDPAMSKLQDLLKNKYQSNWSLGGSLVTVI